MKRQILDLNELVGKRIKTARYVVSADPILAFDDDTFCYFVVENVGRYDTPRVRLGWGDLALGTARSMGVITKEEYEARAEERREEKRAMRRSLYEQLREEFE